MNVRFYLSRVDRANNVLLDKLGVTPAPGSAVVRRQDTYSRFRREQFAGAPLQVAGGMLESDDALVRCYFEIRNPEKDEIAATFIVRSGLVDPASQKVLALPPRLNRVNEQYGISRPWSRESCWPPTSRSCWTTPRCWSCMANIARSRRSHPWPSSRRSSAPSGTRRARPIHLARLQRGARGFA